MDAYVLTLRLQLLEVFRLHVMPQHVFETKRNLGNETNETPVFPNLSFKVVGYSERWLWGMVCWSLFAPLPLPCDDHKMEPKRLVSHKTSIYLRALFKHRTASSFLCASS